MSNELETVFQDFDGVYINPDLESTGLTDGRSTPKPCHPDRNLPGSLPDIPWNPYGYIPGEDVALEGSTTHYPGLVPEMVNLTPSRSQLSPAEAQAARRSLLSGNQRSGTCLSTQMQFEPDAENSRSSNHTVFGHKSTGALPVGFTKHNTGTELAELPHQVRADEFFDHPSVRYDERSQSEFGDAGLDFFSDASATASVTTFTSPPNMAASHQQACDQKLSSRESTSSALTRATTEGPDGSINATDYLSRPIDAISLTETSQREGSIRTITGNSGLGSMRMDVEQRQSSDSGEVSQNGDEYDRADGDVNGRIDSISSSNVAHVNGEAGKEPKSRSSTSSVASDISPTAPGEAEAPSSQVSDDETEQQEGQDLIDPEGVADFVQPATLLAELQIRKAQLRSRNRNAVTAFPNGMYSTLLQMDAVEEVARRKRKQSRIPLAWEDPHARLLAEEQEGEDDDIPLAVLFPPKDHLVQKRPGNAQDWDLPLGLLDQRAMEDNEPLSQRRTRLKKVSGLRSENAGKRPGATNGPMSNETEQQNVQHDENQHDSDENETLAQRMRRMRTSAAVSATLADLTSRDNEQRQSDSTADLLNKSGESFVHNGSDLNFAAKACGDDAEETLAQRRRRLQREREESGMDASQGKPAHPSFLSMAGAIEYSDISDQFAANMIGQNGHIDGVNNRNSRLPSLAPQYIISPEIQPMAATTTTTTTQRVSRVHASIPDMPRCVVVVEDAGPAATQARRQTAIVHNPFSHRNLATNAFEGAV